MFLETLFGLFQSWMSGGEAIFGPAFGHAFVTVFAGAKASVPLGILWLVGTEASTTAGTAEVFHGSDHLEEGFGFEVEELAELLVASKLVATTDAKLVPDDGEA